MTAGRYTIILDCDDPDHDAQFDQVTAWLAANAGQFAYMSENEGCGCCVNIWEVECDEALMAGLPPLCWSRRTE